MSSFWGRGPRMQQVPVYIPPAPPKERTTYVKMIGGERYERPAYEVVSAHGLVTVVGPGYRWSINSNSLESIEIKDKK